MPSKTLQGVKAKSQINGNNFSCRFQQKLQKSTTARSTYRVLYLSHCLQHVASVDQRMVVSLKSR